MGGALFLPALQVSRPRWSYSWIIKKWFIEVSLHRSACSLCRAGLQHVDCGCIACVLCITAWLVHRACICAYRSWLLSWKRLQWSIGRFVCQWWVWLAALLFFLFFPVLHLMPSVLWRCWLGGRKGIRPVKKWVAGVGMVICLEQGADLHMAQRMPLPLTISCFSKIQIGFTFLVPAYSGSPGKRAVKRVCVCVCVSCAALEWWDAGMVICVERDADLHMAQLMPLPLTTSCFSKSRLVLPFWYRLTWVVPEKEP